MGVERKATMEPPELAIHLKTSKGLHKPLLPIIKKKGNDYNRSNNSISGEANTATKRTTVVQFSGPEQDPSQRSAWKTTCSMVSPIAEQGKSTLDANDLKTSFEMIPAPSKLQSSLHEEGYDEQDSNKRSAWETTESQSSTSSILPPRAARRRSTLEVNDLNAFITAKSNSSCCRSFPEE